MKISTKLALFSFISIFSFSIVSAMDYKFEDFVGSWHGKFIKPEYKEEYDMTLQIFEDGTYTENTGHFMPSIYPDTQEFSYDAATNRINFRYLQVVYAGRKTYTNIYYEIITFENGYLEAHYNFWDDAEPNSDFGIIRLYKEGTLDVEESIAFHEKKLIRVINMMGVEVSPETYNEMLIFQFDDGSIEKKVIIP
jgi:hypothetical protein